MKQTKRSQLSLGSFRGIPLVLDLSWGLVFALISWSLATLVLPGLIPGISHLTAWIVGVVTALFFSVSVLFHEAAHAIAAGRFGISTRRIGLFAFGGMAELENEPPSPLSEWWITVSGPLASAFLGILFAGFALIAQLTTHSASMVTAALLLARLNFIMCVFNLLPGFPLDGGRMLRAFLWRASGNFNRSSRWAGMLGQALAIGFIVYGVWWGVARDMSQGIWFVMLGFFLCTAATQALRQLKHRSNLHTIQVHEVLNKSLDARSLTAPTSSQLAIAPNAPLEQALQTMVHHELTVLPVVNDERLVGVISKRGILRYLRINGISS